MMDAPKWTQANRNRNSNCVQMDATEERNLQPAQRLDVVEKFKAKIQEEAKEKQGTRNDLTSSPIGENDDKVHTDKELAKLAGVGTGTVARYNKVMKSSNL